VYWIIGMTEQSQRELLHTLKAALNDVSWDEVAKQTEIKPRTLKSYVLPTESNGHRGMDKFVRDAVERVLKKAQKKGK